MENDKNELINNENLMSSDVFKIEYIDQKLDNNTKFQNWKKDMRNIYGNKLKIIKCSKDNIYFCTNKNESIHKYRYKCPKCNKSICCYCLQTFKTILLYQRKI